MRVQARLDAPGWEDVLLWQVSARGPVKAVLPELPEDLPWVIESAVYTPMGVELDAKGVGRWRMQWRSQVLQRFGKPGQPVIGAAPFAYGDEMDYKLTPDEASFTSVSRSVANTPRNGRSHTVTFTSPGVVGRADDHLTVAPRLVRCDGDGV